MNKDFIYKEKPEFTEENKFYLECLEKGKIKDIKLLEQNLKDFPEKLLNKWTNNPLTDTCINDSFENISKQISNSKISPKIIYITKDIKHPENIDFENTHNLQNLFSYLLNGLHIRRVEMLSDIALLNIRDLLSIQNEVTFMNIGPGIFPLEKRIIEQLTTQEREKVKFLALDVSDNLLKYGISNRLIDYGYVADLSKITPGDIHEKIDILVMSEVIEHIFHPSSVLKKLFEVFNSNNFKFIGSVPNSIQLAEIIPTIQGTSSPHQLSRPLFDELNDHLSFFNFNSLVLLLKDLKFSKINIVSNAVRIEKNGNSANITAGLKYVTVGDRFIFWGS